MEDIKRFIAGFRSFQKDYFGPDSSQFDALQHGQSPKTMLIGCSDSRVDPAILTNCAPGDIFVVRNVANLVPPYEQGGGMHGVSAALEFAVCHLEVEHIIVLGHSTCGGISALMSGRCGCGCGGESFISRWMSMAEHVRDQVSRALPGKDAKLLQRAVEQAVILLSLENLVSFPFVAARVAERQLSLHGWYFDLEKGELLGYHSENGLFEPLS